MSRMAVSLMVLLSALPAIAQSDAQAKRVHLLPHIADGDGWRSSVLVTNVAQSASFCMLELHGLTVDRFEEVDGVTASGSSATFELPAHAGNLVWESRNEAALASGYATLDCAAPVVVQVVFASIGQGERPAGIATVFSSQAGREFQFPVLTRAGTLGFAIANDENANSSCDVVLQDTRGVALGEAVLSVPSKSNRSHMLNAVIAIPETFREGSATVSCDQPVSMVGLHFELESDGSIVTFNTLPPAILDASPYPSDLQAKRFHRLPHIADGGGWQSVLLVTNVSQSASPCTLQLHGLSLDRFEDAGGITAAGVTATFELPGAGGYLAWRTRNEAAVASGYATLDCGVPVVAQVAFASIGGEGRPVGMATVFSSQAAELVQLPVLTAAGTVGLAIANDTPADATCRIVLRDSEGMSLGAGAITVPAKTNVARMLNAAVEIPEGFRGGTARVGCDREVAVIGLHFELEPDRAIITFNTLPPAVIDPIRPAVRLSALPASIDWGDRATLTWSSSNAVGATITPDVGEVGPSGSREVSPTVTTTYRITVTSGDGVTATASTVIRVAVTERGVLTVLYEASGGTNWIKRTNWLTEAPLGSWHGVKVDGAGRVVRLELDSNNLVGRIPAEITQLTRLERLSLENNTLGGTIPTEIARLSRLSYLVLSRNDLTGEIPPQLGRLARMTTLGVSNNRLSGTIPPQLGDLSNLEWLDLSHNDLTGEVPPQLAIPGLYTLLLHGNILHGPVPSSFLGSGLEGFSFAFPEHRNLYLCLPGTAAFVAWSARVSGEPTTRFCNESDQAGLRALYEATGGAGWTNAGGWLSGPAVAGWHGVESDSLGRVIALDLTNNGLSGKLPAALGRLSAMTELRIAHNPLDGRLPASLAAVPLRELSYAGTGLCAPQEAPFRAWLNTVAVHEGTGVECARMTDRDILEILYHATGGPNWKVRRNWLTDGPLGDWHGVEIDAGGRVISLVLPENNLSGVIPAELGLLAHLEKLELFGNPLKGPLPPELGHLSNLRTLYLFFTQLSGEIPGELGRLGALEELWLERIPLRGPIPRELGNLSRLRFLVMRYCNLSGPIPPELGRLTRLEKLYLAENNLSGEIPQTLGNLTRLNTLVLNQNSLTGPVPAELGALAALEFAWLNDNGLTGPLPPELGGLSAARVLALSNNDLTGGLPTTFGGLTRLEFLNLSNNPRMAGGLPPSLAALDRLDTFHAGGTALCAPDEAGFQAWLATVINQRVLHCSKGGRSKAYLTQAVQSLDYPVPLVAGRPALLRVFVTARRKTNAAIPPVRARFYDGGAEVHVENIPAGSESIPIQIEEGRLSKSANARIPAGVIRPGLEMVIEVDPRGTLDPGLGVERRIPATGRATVQVESMPPLRLTWIPMISRESPDSSILDLSRGLTAESPLFRPMRTLLPISEFELVVHDAVRTSTRDAFELLREVEAIRVMEGGTGYYMGSMANLTGSIGVAHTPGESSVVAPGDYTVAHELGHNLNLSHAPCGGAGAPDLWFPSATASIGAWGYDFRGGGLVPPSHKDLMAYCSPQWISDYHFTKALLYRLDRQAAAGAADRRAGTVQSLLLWGGLDEAGAPVLEPAFLVDAPPMLPPVRGAYKITGENAGGEVLFSLGFDMPGVSHGGAPSFAFALPVRPEWAGRLERITLTGPVGSVSLDAGSRQPTTITRDPGSGHVLSILRGDGTADGAQVSAEAAAAQEREIEVLFSRGVPDEAAWERYRRR